MLFFFCTYSASGRADIDINKGILYVKDIAWSDYFHI